MKINCLNCTYLIFLVTCGLLSHCWEEKILILSEEKTYILSSSPFCYLSIHAACIYLSQNTISLIPSQTFLGTVMVRMPSEDIVEVMSAAFTNPGNVKLRRKLFLDIDPSFCCSALPSTTTSSSSMTFTFTSPAIKSCTSITTWIIKNPCVTKVSALSNHEFIGWIVPFHRLHEPWWL